MKVVITKLESNPELEALRIDDDEGKQVFAVGYSKDVVTSAFLRLSGEIQQLEAEIEEITAKFHHLHEIRVALGRHTDSV